MKYCFLFWGVFISFMAIIGGISLYFCSCDDSVNLFQQSSCFYTNQGGVKRMLHKIEFENHSYILMRNLWSSAGDCILHDPDCKWFTKKEKTWIG